jgi:hypothetical protein
MILRVSCRARPPAAAPVALALALITAWSGPAHAQSGETCATAYEHAQELRLRGELVGARRELDVCTATCPAALARDCDAWRREVAARLARLRIEVVVGGARVAPHGLWIDGAPAVPGPEGVVALDPGAHEVRVAVEGAQPATRSTTVAPGATTTLRIELATARPTEDDGSWTPPTSAIVVGAAGAGALLVGAGLGIAGHARVGDLRDTCAPDCAGSDVDAVRSMWIAGGVSAGLGVGALALAVALALGDEAAEPDAADRALALTGTPAGAPLGLGARVRF